MQILTGYDHLLFVSALVVATLSFWEFVKVIAAFTLAHTITLALSVFDIFRLPPGIVQPVIALNIVFVSLENILRPQRAQGWWSPFALGSSTGWVLPGDCSMPCKVSRPSASGSHWRHFVRGLNSDIRSLCCRSPSNQSEGFARRGGAIGFVKVNNAVKFDAKPKAATRCGLTVRSKPLRVDREVVNQALGDACFSVAIVPERPCGRRWGKRIILAFAK